jgi:hypothetical protein
VFEFHEAAYNCLFDTIGNLDKAVGGLRFVSIGSTETPLATQTRVHRVRRVHRVLIPNTGGGGIHYIHLTLYRLHCAVFRSFRDAPEPSEEILHLLTASLGSLLLKTLLQLDEMCNVESRN